MIHSQNLAELTFRIASLFRNIAIYKMQQKQTIGFDNRKKFERFNQNLERSKRDINRYTDISFIDNPKDEPKELIQLLRNLSKLNDFLETLPEKAKNELFEEIRQQTINLIEDISRYNYLESPQYDLLD